MQTEVALVTIGSAFEIKKLY